MCNKLLKGNPYKICTNQSFLSSLFGIHLYYGTYPVTTDGSLLGIRHFLSQPNSYRIMFDLFAIAAASGVYVVPLYTILQKNSPLDHCSRIMAATNVVSALFMITATIVSFFALYTLKISVIKLYTLTAILNLPLSIYLIKILPASTLRPFAAKIIGNISVKTNGLENLQAVIVWSSFVTTFHS